MIIVDHIGSNVAEFLKTGIEFLNSQIGFPDTLKIHLDRCGEPNAFYDLNDSSITICGELEEFLREPYQKM